MLEGIIGLLIGVGAICVVVILCAAVDVISDMVKRGK